MEMDQMNRPAAPTITVAIPILVQTGH